MSVRPYTYSNTKKGKDSDLSKRSSIARQTRLLSVKVAVLSVLISVISSLIIFFAQAKIGIINDVSNFLVLGRENIVTLQRELGYDQLVGYAYAEKHIRNKFGFTQIGAHEQERCTCLLRKTIYAANDQIDLCLSFSQKYRLIKEVNTLKGTKTLIFEKNHSFSWETFINFSLIIIGMIFLFSVLFVWFYRGIMNAVFHPFYGVYRYLNEGNESFLNTSLTEVEKLYTAIKNRSEVERELAELGKKTAVLRAIATTTQMVAHDVRRPLDMVSKFIRRVPTLSEDGLTSYAKRSAPSIERAASDAYGMLEDLMDISSDRRKLIKENVNLEKFLKSITSEFHEEEQIDVQVRDIESVLIDSSKIKRVLSNILRNAFEAAKKPARFWIDAKPITNGDFLITIGNTGSHIQADQVPHIFDAFYTAGKGNGKGLGMAIARKFVEEHGGEIWCESNGFSAKNAVSEGWLQDYVLFHIRLPLE